MNEEFVVHGYGFYFVGINPVPKLGLKRKLPLAHIQHSLTLIQHRHKKSLQNEYFEGFLLVF
jgi:hypothetical protein